ncbi:MAG: DUF1343 domain-containing protein [Candidatus Marinimicrobia bacterium]|nr:DUF1343 domain-containing protein [Candidatus Neomarinimicrobiota bacterium]
MRSTKTVFILCAGIFLLMSCSVNTVVNTGLDNARNEGFSIFEGKSVGVVTNHTAIDRNGDHLVDLLDAEETVKVKAIFAPEHGFRGDTEAGVHLEDNNGPWKPVRSSSSIRRQHPEAHIRDAGRCGRTYLRYSGCRRTILHRHIHHGKYYGSRRRTRYPGLYHGPSQS